jgi:DNA mismatch repair protein MutL
MLSPVSCLLSTSIKMKVKLLSKDLIGLIAAGEVIERPASVVKELVENSIDAGATSISVEFSGAGIEFIRIADNGSGMDEADLDTAILRHATSKLEKAEDLFNIKTLGFRGEAVPSIAAVSWMKISSRPEQSSSGSFISMEAGEIIERGKKGMPAGTIIEVSDLFFNMPARKKFLKTPATEQKNMLDVISRSALAHPDITFSISTEGRRIFNISASMSPADRAGIIAGTDFKERMKEFSRQAQTLYVHGMLASPDVNRPMRSSIYTFVNGRTVKDTVVSGAVLEGFSGMLMRGRYPVVVLFIDIEPAYVDVNVHPTKAEVRFREPSRIYGLIVSVIRETLSSAGHSQYERPGLAETPFIMPEAQYDSPYSQSSFFDRTDEPGRFYSNKSVIGVLKSTYVLLNDDDAFYILDQHASHERIVFEHLKNSDISGSQLLLHPIVVELTAPEFAVFEEIRDQLDAIGIEAEPFGEREIAVRTVPALLKDSDIKDIIHEIVHEPLPKQTDERREEIISRIACHSSVRAGQTLTQPEIAALMRQLDEAGAPITCPHGRPIFKRIPLEEIERWIGRKP